MKYYEEVLVLENFLSDSWTWVYFCWP